MNCDLISLTEIFATNSNHSSRYDHLPVATYQRLVCRKSISDTNILVLIPNASLARLAVCVRVREGKHPPNKYTHPP